MKSIDLMLSQKKSMVVIIILFGKVQEVHSKVEQVEVNVSSVPEIRVGEEMNKRTEETV